MKRIMSVMLAVFALGIACFGFVGAAQGNDVSDKVGVCHRTAADTNPYVYIEVPAEEANGHITGTDKQHNEQVTWKSDGTWRGVAHVAGDLKLDYYATSSADCEDVVPTPTETVTVTPSETPTVTETPREFPRPTYTPPTYCNGRPVVGGVCYPTSSPTTQPTFTAPLPTVIDSGK